MPSAVCKTTVHPNQTLSAEASANSATKSVVTILLVGITLAVFLLPPYFALLLSDEGYHYSLVLMVCVNWSMLNAIMDPLIYSLRMSEIRVGYTKMFEYIRSRKDIF